MPVYKYRDVADMPDATWYEPGDPRLFAAIRATWHLAATMAPARFPPGVYKHASIEAADALREQWDQANFDALHARRAGKTEAPAPPPEPEP